MEIIPTIAMILTESSKSPTFPGIGGLLAWWVCDRNKRNPIGGWLQYFYWNLYGGALVSLAFIAMQTNSYIPEYVGDTKVYLLFLCSVAPGVVMLFIQVVAGTFLLMVRTPEMLRLFKWLIGTSAIVGFIGIGLDTLYNPDNIPLAAIGLVADCLWLLYFFRSKRVKHVFQANDWEAAVVNIYPPKADATVG